MPETTDPDGYIVATRNSTGMVRLSWSADVLRTRDEADEELELARSHETGLSWLLFEVREAGAVPGTPAATSPRKITAGQLDDVAHAVVDEYMHTAPKVIDVLMIAREATARGAALSPAPVPDDTQRTVLAELAAGMRQITELLGMDPEAGEVGPVVERVRALVSPAPGNEPDGTAEREVVADFCAERERYITSINNCAPDNYHDYYRWQGHAEARRQLAQRLERAASVAQEGGER